MQMENASTNQTKNSSKWLILIIVVMSVFMSCLDGSIVNVALPVMTKSLQVTTADIQWVVVSYLIVISAAILIFGRLGDIVGKSKVFLWGILIFTLGSLLCGITKSLLILIAARVIQAVGAAASMANSQGIVTETFPAKERGRALGITGTFVALGSLVGPPLGGFIVNAMKWEDIFLINVPFGILTFIFGIKILPKSPQKKQKEKLDIPGALLFVIAIVSLFVSIGEGQKSGFANKLVIAGLLLTVLSFVLFIICEKKQLSPLLQLQIFHNKLFSLSIFCGYISFVAIFCTTIIQPFYLQYVMRFSPAVTGLIMATYPLVLSVTAPVSGYVSDRIGSEILTLFGLLFTSGGLLLMSTLNEQSSITLMIVYIAVMALGNGMFQSPNNSLVMSTVPPERLGIAGSVNALVRNLGMICGTVLATTILYSRMSGILGYRVTDYVEGQSGAFISGMSAVYVTAFGICFLGAVLTGYRLLMSRSRNVKELS